MEVDEKFLNVICYISTRAIVCVNPGQKELELVQMKHNLVAGDRRANEHPFLSSVHAIFLREHNRIAKLLKEYLPPHLQQVKI